MADIFTKTNAQCLLRNKTVWFFGDSNVRGTYKDLVWLLQRNSLITLESLRNKLEKNYMNDQLMKGKKLGRGRDFQEERKYYNPETKTTVEFTFLTKCLCEDLVEKLKKIRSHPKSAPDVVIMNSCVWDILRWGPEGVSKYKRNIPDLMKLLRSSLPPSTLFLWTTTPPIAADPTGGFLIKQIEFMKHTIRFEVMEANMFVRQEVLSSGFDVLDIHYHLLLQIHRRRPDGIHWEVDAVRHITNLILTHITLAWGLELPGNFKSPIIEKMKSFIPEPVSNVRETITELEGISNSLQADDNSSNSENTSNALDRPARRRRYQRNMHDNGSSTQNSNSNGNNDPDFDIWVSGDFPDFTNEFRQAENGNNIQMETLNPVPNNNENGYNNDNSRPSNNEFNNRRYNNRRNRSYRPY